MWALLLSLLFTLFGDNTASLGLGAWVIAEPRHILVLSDHVTLRLCEAGVCDSFCCLPPYLQKHKLQRTQHHAGPTLQTPLLLQAVTTLSSIPETQGPSPSSQRPRVPLLHPTLFVILLLVRITCSFSSVENSILSHHHLLRAASPILKTACI